MESKEKKGFRLNIIDVFLLFIAAALIVSTVIRYQDSDNLPKQEKLTSVEIKFLIEDMRQELVSGVVIGEDIYLAQNDTYLGNLKSADFQKAQLFYTGEDGIPVTYESERSYDVRCVMSAEGILSSRGFLLDGQTYLAAGQTLVIKTASLTVSVLITDISVME